MFTLLTACVIVKAACAESEKVTRGKKLHVVSGCHCNVLKPIAIGMEIAYILSESKINRPERATTKEKYEHEKRSGAHVRHCAD